MAQETIVLATASAFLKLFDKLLQSTKREFRMQLLSAMNLNVRERSIVFCGLKKKGFFTLS